MLSGCHLELPKVKDQWLVGAHSSVTPLFSEWTRISFWVTLRLTSSISVFQDSIMLLRPAMLPKNRLHCKLAHDSFHSSTAGKQPMSDPGLEVGPQLLQKSHALAPGKRNHQLRHECALGSCDMQNHGNQWNDLGRIEGSKASWICCPPNSHISCQQVVQLISPQHILFLQIWESWNGLPRCDPVPGCAKGRYECQRK